MNTNWDVIVIGGGTAGVFAAIASARQGARTLLVERQGHLGGNLAIGMTMGGCFDGEDRQVVAGIPQEMVERVVRMGGGRGHLFFRSIDRSMSSMASIDPEYVKLIASDMIAESGCCAWLYTSFVRGLRTGDLIDAVEVVNKAGLIRLKAQAYVDSTGDADLAVSVGVPCEQGGGTRNQAVTCIVRIGNVNLPKLQEHMNRNVNTCHKDPWTPENAFLRASSSYWTPWKDTPGWSASLPKLFCIYHHGMAGDVFLNATHTAVNSLEPDELSSATVRLRKQAMNIFGFLKSHVAGFEDAYLAHVYDLGLRESRRILGEYQLTIEDIVSERQFEDVVAMGAYPPDLHDADAGDILLSGEGWGNARKEQDLLNTKKIPYNPGYQIPYRSLLPKNIGNLLVAGRCISATFEAQSGTRGMGPCAAMGQAAGTAAALAARTGRTAKQVDASFLQAKLLENGVCLGFQGRSGPAVRKNSV